MLLDIYISCEDCINHEICFEFNLINFLSFIEMKKPSLNNFFVELNSSQIELLAGFLFMDPFIKLSESYLNLIKDFPLFLTYEIGVYSSLSGRFIAPSACWKWPEFFLNSDFIIV